MSQAPDEADGTVAGQETITDVGVGGSSGGGGSATGGSSGNTTPSSRSSPATADRASADSRRVAPKWLGKKIGRFRLQALLGAGAVGRVFRAEDAILHRRVALKVISIHTDDGQINRNADQFITEARAAAALEHPHVVQIYEAGESGNLCYIAMELLDGGSLKDLVDAGGPMDPGRACQLTADAADALAAGHQAGIIHRDIKPANLMLSRQGRCKVTDFGLATFGDLDSIPRDKAAGTPLFVAPEVVRGTSADERSDIYSLGATLYYLLTGRAPYRAKTRQEVLRMHVEEPIPDLRVVRPGLPESLVAAVEKALDKDPGQRFASALQFARVLRVQSIPTMAAPVAPPPSGSQGLPDGSPGASLMGLSGMTAVSGSSRQLPVGRAGSGPLTADDLATPVRPAAAPAVAPPVVSYDTPVAGDRPWWKSPAGLVTLSVAGVTFLVFTILLIRPTSRPTPPVVGMMPPVAAPPLVPLAPAVPVAPGVTAAPAVVVTTPPATTVKRPLPAVIPLTAAESLPIPVTDVDHLHRIGDGLDPDRPNRFATIVGRVARTKPSANGKTIRIEFDNTKFWIAYWSTNKIITGHMAERFGDNAAGLVGKTVRVTEKVTIYDGQPEQILTATDHVKVEGT